MNIIINSNVDELNTCIDTLIYSYVGKGQKVILLYDVINNEYYNKNLNILNISLLNGLSGENNKEDVDVFVIKQEYPYNYLKKEIKNFCESMENYQMIYASTEIEDACFFVEE